MSQSIQTHPVHIHDCDSCTYLGTIRSQDREGEVADLYTCGNNWQSQTVIARYSDHGPDYSSVPLFMLQTNGYPLKDIMEAYNRVK